MNDNVISTVFLLVLCLFPYVLVLVLPLYIYQLYKHKRSKKANKMIDSKRDEIKAALCVLGVLGLLCLAGMLENAPLP